MGSYSFEVSFALGLATAATNLSEQSIAILQGHALDRLATSFNRVDQSYAVEQDLLVAADPQGRIWQLSPWLGKMIPFPAAAPTGPVQIIEPGIFRRTDLSIVSKTGEFFALLSGAAAQLETIRFNPAGQVSWRSVELAYHHGKYGRSYLNESNKLFFQTGFSGTRYRSSRFR